MAGLQQLSNKPEAVNAGLLSPFFRSLKMASTGRTVAGTDGADFEHRETVASQYQIRSVPILANELIVVVFILQSLHF